MDKCFACGVRVYASTITLSCYGTAKLCDECMGQYNQAVMDWPEWSAKCEAELAWEIVVSELRGGTPLSRTTGPRPSLLAANRALGKRIVAWLRDHAKCQDEPGAPGTAVGST